MFYDGASQSTGDSLGFGVLSLGDGLMTQWTSMFAERGHLIPLLDGAASLQVSQTAEFLTYFKVTGPGQIQRLGASTRPTRAVTVSADLKRATVYRRDYRADAWISRVIRQ